MIFIVYKDKWTSEIKQINRDEWNQFRFDGYCMAKDKDLVFIKEDEEIMPEQRKLK